MMDMNATGENMTLSSADCLWRFVARLVIQFETPVHVGSGREWNESDAGVVLDANGLPAIPGGTIAGVLREAWEIANGKGSSDTLFGFQTPAHETRLLRGQGQGSRLTTSWASVHGRNDRPVYGLTEVDPSDEVLKAARNPTLRDHCRHNDRGVAAHRGKFDELVVQAGHRFTFECELAGRKEDRAAWCRLLAILNDPMTRFGGKVRRGLGRFKVVRISERCFDLKDTNDFGAFCAVDPDLGLPLPEAEWERWEKWRDRVGSDYFQPRPVTTRTLRLAPRFFWMFGGGSDPEADMAPVRDKFIIWAEAGGKDQGSAQDRFYLPGSGVKGGFRHRAMFHACALKGCYADQADQPGWQEKFKDADSIVQELFGEQLQPEHHGREAPCVPGSIFIDDIFLDEDKELLLPHTKDKFLSEPHLQHHVSCDRFTSGTRDGALFTENPLFQHPEPIEILVRVCGEPSADAQSVLGMTLDDVCESRLPLGAGSGRGLGYFEGVANENPEAAHAS